MLARLHRAQEVGEPPAGLVGITARERLELGDPIDAEVAEIVAAFAPRADGPGAAPEVQRQRPDFPRARLVAGIAIIEPQHTVLADRRAHRFELLHRLA